MKSKTTLFFLMCFCYIASFAQSPWTNYTNDRNIDDVLVDGNDVWVASQGGLTRTNMLTGEFQTYLPYNSPIIGGGIEAIEEGPDGSLWMLSENAGLFHLKNEEWTNYYDGIVSEANHKLKNLQVLPNGDVWLLVDRAGNQSISNFIRIRDGVVQPFGNLPKHIKSFAVLEEQSIFISNSDTIHRYDALLEKVVEVFHSGNSIILPDETFRDIIIFRNSKLILPSLSRILQMENGTISVLSTQGVPVNRSFKDAVGNVYLQPDNNNTNNIRLVRYNGLTVKYFNEEDLKPYPALENPIFRGADGEGRLYAIIWNLDTEYTLFRFEENVWTPVRTQIFPLLDNYQSDVQSDCEGNLWFSSRGGVDVRYADGNWKHFSVGQDQQNYFSSDQMTIDPVTCDVWFANNSNTTHALVPGIIRISNDSVTHFLPGHANVDDIEATIDGKVYFFSGISGFGYIQNDEIHYIDQDEMEFVSSMDSDSKGNLYLADWGSDLIKYDGQSFTHLGIGELHEYVYNVFVDNDDHVWVYFSAGLFHFDGVTWTNYNELLPVDHFNGIVQDKKGNYWVSTWNDGLYYWDKQSLQHYDIFNSDLTTNSLRSVALDPDGNLIVTQLVGASVLDIPEITGVYKGTGNVFFDAEKNGAFDETKDILVPGQKIMDTDRNGWTVTNSYGTYAIYGDAPQEYSYLHLLEPNAESTTENPQTASLIDYQSILPDFGFWKPNVPDVDVTIVNGTPVCNRDFRVYIYLQNNSTYTSTGYLTFNFNDLLILKESSVPISFQFNGQLLIENISIEPFAVLDIKLDLTAPGLPTGGIDLFFEGIFHASENTFKGTALDSIVCSYDPNDKKVEPTGDFFNDYSLIKDPLKYTIRFQNEGTYKAFDITIIDTLDQQLDPSTFELLASSHAVETTITAEGIVSFIFRNIDLPHRAADELGSQGFVTFSIMPDSNLNDFAKIFNEASIYFDFNPPVVTNTTQWNVVDDLATVSIKEVNGNISIYPNPTQGTLFLSMHKECLYHVSDGTGRQIHSGFLHTGNNTIHLNTQSGIYYLQVKDGNEVYAPVKIVVIRNE